MKRPLHILAIVSLVWLSAACRQDVPEVSTLQRAEALIMQHPDSVKAYEQLLRLAASEAEGTADWLTASRALLLLAAQTQWTNEIEALALAYQALELYDRGNYGEAERLQIQLAIADYLHQTDDITRARVLNKECLQAADKLHDAHSRNIALGNLARLELAENHPYEALALARQMHIDGNDAAQMEPLFILANCYLQCDSLEQARLVYARFDTCRNTKARYVALRHLTEIAMLENDVDMAATYMDSAFVSAEAVFFQALRQKDDYLRTTLAQEREAERLMAQQRQWRWLLFFVVIVGALLALLGIVMNRHRRAIHRQRLASEQRERELAEQRLAQQETMIQVLQNFIIEKSEVIQRLRAETNEKRQLSEADWREMEQTLDGITDGFVSRLRAQHPDFSEEDVQLCMLTRMKLSNQTIADLYFITTSAVKHRKLKLKKDGFGEPNPDTKLFDVLGRMGLLFLFLHVLPLHGQQAVTMWKPVPVLEVSHGVHVTSVELSPEQTSVGFSVSRAEAVSFRLAPSISLSDEEGKAYACRQATGIALGTDVAVPADSALTFTLAFDALPQQTRLFDIVEGVAAGRCWMGVHSSLRTIRFPSVRARMMAEGEISPQAQELIDRFGVSALLGVGVPDSVFTHYELQLAAFRDYMAWKWHLSPHELYHLMYRSEARPAARKVTAQPQQRAGHGVTTGTHTAGNGQGNGRGSVPAATQDDPPRGNFFSRLFGRKKKAQPMSAFEQKMLQEQRGRGRK